MAGNKNENNKQESPALKWLRNAILGMPIYFNGITDGRNNK